MDNSAAELAFTQALLDQGLIPNEKDGGVIMDGKMHRAHAIKGKEGNLDGAYTGYLDGRPAGYIKNHYAQTESKWKFEGKVIVLTVQQKQAAVLTIKAKQQQREQERTTRYKQTASAVAQRLTRAPALALNDKTPYLARKQVLAYGLRHEGNNLLVPARDIDGHIWSVQTIFPEKKTLPDGNVLDKVFAKDSKKEGNFHVLGEIRAGEPLLVGEGYATAASVHMATGHTTVVAFDSGNLDAVVGALKGRYPESPIVILGDDDLYNPLGNIGRIKANAAAEKYQVGAIFPQFSTIAAQEKKFTDFNDLHVSEGLGSIKVQLDNFIKNNVKGKIMDQPSIDEKKPLLADRPSKKDLTPEQNIEDEQLANGISKRAHAWSMRNNDAKEMSNDSARRRVASDIDAALNISGKDAYQNAVLSMAISQRDIVPYREQFYKKAPAWLIEDAQTLSPMSFKHKEIDKARAKGEEQMRQRQHDVRTNPMTSQEIFDASRAERALEQAKATTPLPATMEENTIEAGPARQSLRDKLFSPSQQQNNAEKDAALYRQIVGDAEFVMTAPKNGLTRLDMRDMVADHIKKVGDIKDADLRKMAIEKPMAEAAFAQPAYAAELNAQAPVIDLMINPKQTTPVEPSVLASAAASVDKSMAMPDNIKKKFIQVDNTYHFNDHTVAFVDHGKKLSTKSESHDVIRDLVAIAKAREWDSIKIKGTEEFRRAAWMAASLENIQTTGYQPSEVELADLAKKMGNKVSINNPMPENSVEMGPKLEKMVLASIVQAAVPVPIPVSVPAQQPAASKNAITLPKSTGILIAHGHAPYLNDPKKGASYYMTIETEKGPKTLWGKDLQRAIKEGNVDVGQAVLAEKVGQKPVTAREKVFGPDGKEVAEREIDTIKNKWQVGSVTKGMSFATGERADVLQAHPDLIPAYSMQAAAEQFAKQQFPHSPTDQARFTHGVKEATATMISRGEPVAVLERREVKEQGRDMEQIKPPPRQKEAEHNRV